MGQLVYETTDGEFADGAIEAMLEAGIPCYRIGRGSSNQQYAGREGIGPVCVFIEDDADYARANKLLLRLGAAKDEVSLPPQWALFLLAMLAVAVGIWAASAWS